MTKPSAIQVCLAKRLGLSVTSSRDEILRVAMGKMAAMGFGDKKTTARDVEVAKEAYRRLVAEQRKLPLDQQWTMADLIKQAKARAEVLIEAYEQGQ